MSDFLKIPENSEGVVVFFLKVLIRKSCDSIIVWLAERIGLSARVGLLRRNIDQSLSMCIPGLYSRRQVGLLVLPFGSSWKLSISTSRCCHRLLRLILSLLLYSLQ